MSSNHERTPLLANANASGSTSPPQQPEVKPSSEDATSSTTVLPQDLPLSQKCLILAGTFAALFVGAVDMTITAALIQPISASFHASNESSWLGTSFLLASITFTPAFGRLCDILGRRLANALAIGLFTAGTALCFVAPSMKWLIFARFIAGSGGGGMNTTSSVITSDLFALKQRGLVGSISGFMWAFGGALGGPLGGFISDRLGWRAAFGIQVPLLVIALISGIHRINYTVPNAKTDQTTREKLRRIDFAGCALIFLTFGNFLVSLALRNNEGLPWSNPWVILTTTLSPIFLALFIYVEHKHALEPILPIKMLFQRTALFVMLITVCVAVCNFGIMYSLPMFFLAIKGSTAGEAGAHILPTSIANVVGGMTAGIILHRTGKYKLPSIVAGAISVVGVSLIYSLNPNSPVALQWLAIAPMGFGFMFMLNNSFIALLASIPDTQNAAATGMLWLFRSTGQVVGVATTGAILQAILLPALDARLSGLPNSEELIAAIRSDSSIISTLPHHTRVLAREAYGVALKGVFAFCLVFAVLAWASFWFVPALSVERKGPKPAAEQEATEETV